MRRFKLEGTIVVLADDIDDAMRTLSIVMALRPGDNTGGVSWTEPGTDYKVVAEDDPLESAGETVGEA